MEAEAEAKAKAEAEAEAEAKAYARYQRGVAAKHRALRPPAAPLTHDAACFPAERRTQPQQRFVERFLGPGSEHKGLLVYHRAGAGKTCAAVRLAEAWRTHAAAPRRVVVLCPASLVANFRAEMRGPCAGPPASVPDDAYDILSFHAFVKRARGGRFDLRNALLIVDEVQNVVSERGLFYRTLLEVVHAAPDDLRVLLMSATPIGDRPSDIALTLNLLRPAEPLPVGRAFNAEFVVTKHVYGHLKGPDGVYLKGPDGALLTHVVGVERTAANLDRFAALTRHMVSYYEASEAAFPATRRRVVRCPMSAYQWRSYRVHERGRSAGKGYVDLLRLPTDFLLGLRQLSNIAFPSRLTGEEGLDSLTGAALGDDGIATHSSKMARVLRAVDAARGPVFVYSHFLRGVGVECLVRLLEHRGYANVLASPPSAKRYAVWSGDETAAERAAALAAFNRPENRDGRLLKVILGSPAMKEGVSLLRAREVHILEPYWNDARIEQIAGRAVRFCSHRDLKASQRRVDVYVYASVAPEGEGEEGETVDERILAMADAKARLAREFLDVVRDNAVDRDLFFPKT